LVRRVRLSGRPRNAKAIKAPAVTQASKRRTVTPYVWRDTLLGPDGPDSETRLILVVLSLMFGPSRKHCYLGQRAISARTGLSLNTVTRRLIRAERDGWVTRHVTKFGGRAVRTDYFPTIPLDVPPVMPPRGRHQPDDISGVSSGTEIDATHGGTESVNQTLQEGEPEFSAGNHHDVTPVVGDLARKKTLSAHHRRS
jgi:hypothetical protein